MPKPQLNFSRRRIWLNWFIVVLVALALYGLLPQLGSFQDALRVARQAHLDWLGVASLAMMVTYIWAAATYKLLALKPLIYSRTFVVQVASVCASRLLPAGIGALGLNYVYLRRAGHRADQAATVVAVNNSLGFVGHSLLVGLLILLTDAGWQSLQLPDSIKRYGWLIIVVVLAIIIVLAIRGKALARRLGRNLKSYRAHPQRLALALLSSMLLTMAYVISFWCVLQAFDLQLSFVVALLIFTLGISLGTATPTPGGLGGVEAGLVAGLVAYHVPAPQALAAALVYRLITYWLVLMVGILAFVYVRRRRYL